MHVHTIMRTHLHRPIIGISAHADTLPSWEHTCTHRHACHGNTCAHAQTNSYHGYMREYMPSSCPPNTIPCQDMGSAHVSLAAGSYTDPGGAVRALAGDRKQPLRQDPPLQGGPQGRCPARAWVLTGLPLQLELSGPTGQQLVRLLHAAPCAADGKHLLLRPRPGHCPLLGLDTPPYPLPTPALIPTAPALSRDSAHSLLPPRPNPHSPTEQGPPLPPGHLGTFGCG